MSYQLLKDFLRMIPYRLVYLLAAFFPRDKKTWTFIGWRRNSEREIFAENVKYFYLHVNKYNKNIRPIWIGFDDKLCPILKEHNFEAYSIHSWTGIYYSLRSGYTFYGALPLLKNWSLSNGSKIIQLWHGKSAKKTVINSSYNQQRLNKFLSPHVADRPDKIIAISKFLATFTASDFGVDTDDILVTGIPKYDCLIKESALLGAEIDMDEELLSLITELKQTPDSKVILYAPTYRADGQNIMDTLDFTAWDEVLQKKNYFLILTLHPKFFTTDWKPETDLKNILFVSIKYDIYPVLHKFDALITDYSSLSVDFLYMNKPVVIFAPDEEEYEKMPGLHNEIWSALPDPKLKSQTELLEHLKKLNLDSTMESVLESQKKLFNEIHGSASLNIVKELTQAYDLDFIVK